GIERGALPYAADETGDVEIVPENLRVLDFQHVTGSALVRRCFERAREAQSASMNGLVVRHEIRGCRVRRNRLEIQLRVPAGDVRLLRDRRTGDEVVDVVLRICGPEKEAISDDRSARFEAVIADLIDRVG